MPQALSRVAVILIASETAGHMVLHCMFLHQKRRSIARTRIAGIHIIGRAELHEASPEPGAQSLEPHHREPESSNPNHKRARQTLITDAECQKIGYDRLHLGE
jgi:hypothetical protein